MTESDHYAPSRARWYAQHHRKSLRTRLTTWRERHCLYRALCDAGFPQTIMDMPCGTGRFWPSFARAGVTDLIAADGSPAMLEVAAEHRLGAGLPRTLFETSAFDVEVADRSVDLVACLRFYHHLARAEDRLRLLRELKRVSRRYVVLSLWVDGNLGGNRRLRRQRPSNASEYGRRICRRRADVEQEFCQSGFRILGRYDVWPLIYMWRFYLLEHSEG